jgi:hypothetical protein
MNQDGTSGSIPLAIKAERLNARRDKSRAEPPQAHSQSRASPRAGKPAIGEDGRGHRFPGGGRHPQPLLQCRQRGHEQLAAALVVRRPEGEGWPAVSRRLTCLGLRGCGTLVERSLTPASSPKGEAAVASSCWSGLSRNILGAGYVLFDVRALCRLMLVFVVLGAAAGGTLARASLAGRHAARRAPANNVVVRRSFHQVRGVSTILASGDYVLLSKFAPHPFKFKGWVVINQRLGTRTTLDPTCGADAVGPPWVLMDCRGGHDFELYSLTDGTQQIVTPSPGVPPLCFGSGPAAGKYMTCTVSAAIGSSWIRWDTGCYRCFATPSYFQNIETGELLDDPTNATTFADLNSPTLAHKTCPGVRLMRSYQTGSWGSVTFGGQLAVTLDGQFALVTGSNDDVYLERCGTHMRRLLFNIQDSASEDGAIAWNAGAIVWQGAPATRLNGVFLPSLKTFTIPLPSAIFRPPGAGENLGVFDIELSSDTLYVQDDWARKIWRTAAPNRLGRWTRVDQASRSGLIELQESDELPSRLLPCRRPGNRSPAAAPGGCRRAVVAMSAGV